MVWPLMIQVSRNNILWFRIIPAFGHLLNETYYITRIIILAAVQGVESPATLPSITVVYGHWYSEKGIRRILFRNREDKVGEKETGNHFSKCIVIIYKFLDNA